MGNELVMYQKIADPLVAVETLGTAIAESKLFGCKNPSQGKALVMMAMCDNVSITEMKRRYHIVNGVDLTMRADFMLAEFRRLGGEYTWVDDGSDGQKATIHVKYKTNDRNVSYTIKDAEQEGLVKPGSRWAKNPASMLRARAQTTAVRMVCPEVIAGFPADDEIEDDGHVHVYRQAVSTAETGSAPPAPSSAASASKPDEVIDAEFTEKAESTSEVSAPVDGPCDQAQIEKIKTAMKQMAQFEGHANIGERMKAKLQSCGMTRLPDLSYQDAELLIQALAKRNLELFFDASLQGHQTPGESS